MTEVKPDAPETPSVPAPSLDGLTPESWDRLIGERELPPSQQAKLDRVSFVDLRDTGARPLLRFKSTGGAAVPKESLQDIVRLLFPGSDAAVELIAVAEETSISNAAVDAPAEVREDPLIREAMELFDASIINVEKGD